MIDDCLFVWSVLCIFVFEIMILYIIVDFKYFSSISIGNDLVGCVCLMILMKFGG